MLQLETLYVGLKGAVTLITLYLEFPLGDQSSQGCCEIEKAEETCRDLHTYILGFAIVVHMNFASLGLFILVVS